MYDGGAQLSFNIILSGTFEIGLRNIVRYCTKCDPLYKWVSKGLLHCGIS